MGTAGTRLIQGLDPVEIADDLDSSRWWSTRCGCS